MKPFFGIFAVLTVAINAAVLGRKYPDIKVPKDPLLCSTNASSAYLDVIIVIDTSVNMGTANLRKISTMMPMILAKFTIGHQVDITKNERNTRIGVVTYDKGATIAANYTDINSVNDLSNVLNGLTASSSKEADLYDSEKFALIPSVIDETNFFDDGTLIAVNFNTADVTLTTLLKNVTWNYVVNAPMYNLVSSSNSLTRDLEWAILQANCYCEYMGTNLILFDNANNRYTKYAECLDIVSVESEDPVDIKDMCGWQSDRWWIIPAFDLTSERTKFVESVWMGMDPGNGAFDYPYYIGLHKNNQSQWSWFDYDQSEFPLSGYTDWAIGYPNNSTDNCVIFDSDDGIHLQWKTYP